MLLRVTAPAQEGSTGQQEKQTSCEHTASANRVTQSPLNPSSLFPGEDYPGFVWGNTPPQLQATEKQANVYCSLMEVADAVGLHARELSNAVNGRTSELSSARKLEDRLHKELDSMLSKQDAFFSMLTPAQRAATAAYMDRTDRTRSVLKDELQLVDHELNQPEPNGQALAKHVRQLRTSIKRLESQYRGIGEEVGIGS